MKKLMGVFLACFAAAAAHAQPVFPVPDYSGVYDCAGNDAHEGAYSGTVTLQRDAAQSKGEYGAYRFKLEVPGFGTYDGMAVARGEKLAVYFALRDPASRDYGVGIATIRQDKHGKLGFSKFYYEPEYKGGNTGTEECVQR